MKTLAFYVNKGGAGKSTLTFCTACTAAAGDPSLKVLLVSCDPQGDSVRWSKGPGVPPTMPTPGVVAKSPFWFHYLFLPDGFALYKIPNAQAYDVILVDLPPFVESIRSVHPDLWVIPIKDAPSLINTGPALKNMRAQGGKIVFAPNGFADGERELRKCLATLATIPDATVLATIPHRPTISRVATQSAPPWYVTNGTVHGRPRAGAAAMLQACETLLQMAGFRSFSATGVVARYYPEEVAQ